MKLCSISSGSDGNCIYVGGKNANVLVDAGISGKKIEAGLKEIDVNPETLDGIFVTHEHTDHIKSVGVMARRYQIPIYSTVETIYAMLHTKNIGRIPETLLHDVQIDEKIMIKDFMITPFSISHDAVNPVAYTFEEDGHKMGLATDLGTYDAY
ncbi:MAG: MBL fold metallo-hydrolase, partial [Lachnospiraceae bacterium]|nr:MBL fold metallo-hydrolase [Lachnospiraceae bacterium]